MADQYAPDEWDQAHRDIGREWCRPCREWHRPPECTIDQDGSPTDHYAPEVGIINVPLVDASTAPVITDLLATMREAMEMVLAAPPQPQYHFYPPPRH